MISKFRDYLKGGVLKAVLWAIIIMFGGSAVLFLFFRRYSRYGRGYGVRDVVAEVDGISVSAFEYSRKFRELSTLFASQKVFFERIKKMLGSNMAGLYGKSFLDKSPGKEALDFLIRQKLFLNYANSVGLNVYSDLIRKKYLDSSFIKDKMGDYLTPEMSFGKDFDYDDFLRFLAKQKISVRCFEDDLIERIKGDLVEGFVSAGVYVPDPVLRYFFLQKYRAKKIQLIKVPFSYYRDKAIAEDVDLQVLKRHFRLADSSKRYWHPETRSGMVWSFKDISEKDFSSKDFSSKVSSLLAAGKSLEDLVKKYSGEKKEWASLARSDVGKNAAKARLFDLKVKEHASFFVKGKGGFVVLLSKITPAKRKSFEEAKDDVKSDYISKRAGAIRDEDLGKFAKSNLKKGDFGGWIKDRGGKMSSVKLSVLEDESLKALKDKGLTGYALMSASRVLENLSKVGDKKMFADVFSSQDGYVFYLEGYEPLDEKVVSQKLKKMKASFKKGLYLYSLESGRLSEAFLSSLKRNAGIKKYRSV